MYGIGCKSISSIPGSSIFCSRCGAFIVISAVKSLLANWPLFIRHCSGLEVLLLFLLLAAFTASNTMLYESADYMAIGMLVSLCYAERETSESPVFWKSFVLLFVGLAVIHKGFLLYNIYGHDTIFVTRQKAEEGPMAGIYGRYSDGYEYNIRGRLLDEFIPRGSKVLIASHKSIMYLQEDYVICNYSTISTPTIDERLFQYWTLYPDKVPEYIVWDKGSEGYIATNPEVNARLVENAELLVDDEGLLIYRLPANPY